MGTGRREDAVQFVEQFAAGGDPLPAFGLGPAHQCARLGGERFGGRGRCESLRRDCGPRGDRVGRRSLRCRGLRRCSGFIPQCGPVELAAVGTDNFRLTGIGRRGRMREVGRTGRYRKTGGGRPEGSLRSGFGRVPGHEGSVLSPSGPVTEMHEKKRETVATYPVLKAYDSPVMNKRNGSRRWHEPVRA